MNPTTLLYRDTVPRVLAADLTPTATTLAIESGGSSLPSADAFEIQIGDEVIAVGARSGNTLSSLTRGSAGTTAAPHNRYDAVGYIVSAATLAGNGGSQPPIVYVGTDPNAIVLEADAAPGQVTHVLKVKDRDGVTALAAGAANSPAVDVDGGGGPGIRVRVAAGQSGSGIAVVDENNNDCFNVGGDTGVTLSADPIAGKTELQITVTSLVYRDENGDAVLDIEGGFTNIGPAGEIAVTSGQIYLTLPTAPGPSGTLWNDANTVKVVP